MIHFDYWCDPAKKGPGWVHFLRAKESYATFAVSERAAMPDISVMALVAKGLKGEGWKEPTRYAHVKTHWTGFHYIQGGHCWSHKGWVFNEDVAAALDGGETVELVDIPVEQMRGYVCTRDDTIAVLVNESLARRRAHPTDEEEEMVEEVPADASDTETSGWDCPDVRNVYGFCIYNEDEDPCHDNCLFCHHPEERK